MKIILRVSENCEKKILHQNNQTTNNSHLLHRLHTTFPPMTISKQISDETNDKLRTIASPSQSLTTTPPETRPPNSITPREKKPSQSVTASFFFFLFFSPPRNHPRSDAYIHITADQSPRRRVNGSRAGIQPSCIYARETIAAMVTPSRACSTERELTHRSPTRLSWTRRYSGDTPMHYAFRYEHACTTVIPGIFN